MSEPMTFTQLCKQWGIALTGGIASGKSTLAESLRQRAYTVIDADQVARLVVAKGSEGLAEIIDVFGKEFLTPTGEMNRALMREKVFQDPIARQKLESIIHKRLASATSQILTDEGLVNSPRLWFYEASLIYERNRQNDFLEVWVAYCPREVQIQRVMLRDSINQEQAEAILAAQMPSDEKKRLADRVIETDCSREELAQRLTQTLASLNLGVSL